MNRLPISMALFGLGSAITFSPDGVSQIGWTHTSRRLVHWSSCPGQPALYQIKHDEHWVRKYGLPPRVELDYRWVIYHDQGRAEDTVPQDYVDSILDAVQTTLSAQSDPEERETLGGLVWHAWIEGDLFSDDGSLDGQGIIVVPIKVLVPA